jgi:DNA-binding protein H-NS
MASYKDLQQQIAELQRQAAEARKSEIASVVADIRAKMQEYGISVSDLGGSRMRGRMVEPKYRDAATGQTWTGRGKRPRWLAEAVSQGRSVESFLIV